MIQFFYPKFYTHTKTRFGIFRKISVDLTTKFEYTERRRKGRTEMIELRIFLLGFGISITVQE